METVKRLYAVETGNEQIVGYIQLEEYHSTSMVDVLGET